MNKRSLLVLGAAVVGAVAWYLFRPERLVVNKTVSEGFPAAAVAASHAGAAPASGPVALASGRFHGVAHKTRGLATIYQSPEGKRTLRLTEFETSNGPDVQVYLVAASDASDNETVTGAGFVPVGALKGNIGDQNYDLPSEVDLAKYRAVTVWCRRFGVNFATAPLSASAPAAPAAPAALASGAFHGVAHKTHGVATLYQLPDGKRTLRLTDFETSNGPDVQVYLVAASDASDNETVTRAGFVPLGALKGNIGDQNYEVPSDLDLGKYKAVTVWCRRFGVNFATAPLAPAAMPMASKS
ncbi:MAG TPA: DM13 domain-containing protein [Thermoanaerobaculia bacterium]|nr:DM13 domain-containing protein [Thermoanaerobaculia bacterium]